jgi:PAS domain S-box-containing protein
MTNHRELFWEHSNDLLCLHDGQVLVDVNPAWTRVLGWEREEIIGKSWLEFVCPEDREETRLAYGRTGRGFLINRYRVKNEDRVVYLEWSVPELQNIKGPPPYIGVARDVTSRVGAEKSVEKYVSRLRQNAAELKRSNEDLESFAYVASHDLQTPLRKIASFAELLEKEYGHLFKGAGAAEVYMRHISDSARRSQELVNGLLSFSRTGRHMEMGWFPLGDALSDAMEVLRQDIEAAGATLLVGDLPHVVGDRVLLSQVFQNLIGNSLKFRHPERPLEITVYCAPCDEAHVAFKVQDNGVGFEPKFSRKIFLIFQRLPHAQEPGAGIGLTLCKKIVESHGGWIDALGVPGEGATFTVTLPRSRDDYSLLPPSR